MGQVAPLPPDLGVAQGLARVCCAPVSLEECHTRPDQGRLAIPQGEFDMLQFIPLGDNQARLSLLSILRGMVQSL